MNIFQGFTGESLIRWREPRAYVRKELSNNRWIGLLIVFLVPAFLLGVSTINDNFQKRGVIVTVVFLIFGICGFAAAFLGQGETVCLKQDWIVTSGGRFFTKVRYDDIESCRVVSDGYRGEKYTILRFTMRGQDKSILEKLTEVGVPNDVNLDEVFEILSRNGIKIVKE